MAIHPITGRLQQGGRYCARENNKFTANTPCGIRPVMGRMAMLGPPLHNGLYSMAWTVLAGWH